VRSSLPILGALALAACSTTGPNTPLTVSLAGSQVEQGAPALVNGVASYACNYTLIATAIGGSAGEMATWTAATWSTNVTTGSFEASVGDLFPSNPTIASDSTVTQTEQAAIPLPPGPNASFQYNLTLYYSTLTANMDSTKFTFICL
jgi:hypothetical protein